MIVQVGLDRESDDRSRNKWNGAADELSDE